MTAITIPISTPGAGESANALNRAADAVEKLAKGMEHEKQAASQAANETKRAAQAATEFAAAEAKAEQAMVKRAQATVAAGRMVQSTSVNFTQGTRFDSVRRVDPGNADPGWASGNGVGGGGPSRAQKALVTGGQVSAISSTAGFSSPALSAVTNAAGMAETAGAATLLVGLAGAALVVKSIFEKVAKAAADVAATFAAARDAEKQFTAARSAANQAGLSVYERTKQNATLTAGQSGDAGISRAQAIAKSRNISIDDALSMTAAGLTGDQERAAILASKTLGISVSEASGKIKAGRWMGTPEQIVAGISGGRLNANEVQGRAAKLATSSYGLMSSSADAAIADSSLAEFGLIERAGEGASENEQGFIDKKDPRKSFARDMRKGMKDKIGGQADGEEKERLRQQYNFVIDSYVPGQKILNGAAR